MECLPFAFIFHMRLRAVSLLLKNPYRNKRDYELEIRAVSGEAVSSAGVGRRAKRVFSLVF